MLYRNKRTGVEVELSSEVKGEWEKVEQPSPEPVAEEKKPASKRRSTVKKAGK